MDRVLARKFEREIKTDMNLDAHGIYATHTHTHTKLWKQKNKNMKILFINEVVFGLILR